MDTNAQKLKMFRARYLTDIQKVLSKRSPRYFFFTPTLPFIEIACFKTHYVAKM